MHRQHQMIALLIGLITLFAFLRPAYAIDEIITTCDFDSLKQAVENVNTYGGIITFDCTGTIIFTERLVIESDVIILGGSDIIFDGVGQSSFFFVETEGASLTLDGLTLQNGVNSYSRSGAITNTRQSELIISNCIFLNNARRDTYSDEPAAIASWGTLTIRNSTFSGHSEEIAVIRNGGAMTITDSTFNDNRGGAIDSNEHYYGASVTIHNSTFTNNSAESGGAIIGGDLTISDSVFIGNTATDDGGAISRAGFVTITNSTFTNNSATENGGAISHSGFGTLDITDSTFEGNSAQLGSAIYIHRNTVTVKNSVFSDNVATDGQSAIFSDGIVISENTQYENNTCGGYGVFIDSGGNIANNAEGCPPDAVMLQTVVTDCDHFEGIGTISQAVNIAKLTGMPVTFACSGTIMFPHGLYIQGDVSIIGGGDVIFDGGGKAYFFSVGQNYPEFPRSNEVFVESSLVLDGLTLQNGRAIHVNHTGTLTVNNSTFINNSGWYGGAISNSNNLIVTHSTFIGNSASDYGGAINNKGRAVITDSIFIDNSAPLSGAIHNYWGQVSSQNSHYENNTCEGWSAIINDGGNTSDNADGCPRETPTTTVVSDCENFKGAGTLFEAVYVANVTHEPISFTCSGTIVFTEPLIIQGNVTINGDNKIVFDGGGKTLFFTVYGEYTFVLNDLTFQNGSLDFDNHNYAGLIDIYDATVIIRNSTFRDNNLTLGYRIIENNGTLIISNSTFSNNSVNMIIGNGNNLTINDSVFESLSVFVTIYNTGRTAIRNGIFNNSTGLVFYNSGEMTVSGSSFSNNQSLIENSNNMIITDSTFINNSAQNSGGVIHNSHRLIVANSNFADNSAETCGVIMNQAFGYMTVLDSIFDNNVVNQFGGAICNMGEMIVSDSTFSDNSATRGGAIVNTGVTGHPYNPVTQLIIANSEFTNNVATEGNSIFNAHNAMLFTENIQCGNEECIMQEIVDDE